LLFIKPRTNNRIGVLRWNRIGITVVGNASSPRKDSDKLFQPWDLVLDWQDNLIE